MCLVSWAKCTLERNNSLKIERTLVSAKPKKKGKYKTPKQTGKRNRGGGKKKHKRPTYKYRKLVGQTWLREEQLSSGYYLLMHYLFTYSNVFQIYRTPLVAPRSRVRATPET